MRLALDAHPCAPAGCRIQSLRHDSLKQEKPMKPTNLKITVDGKPVKMDAGRFAALRAAKFDAAVIKADEIPLTNVKFTTGDEPEQEMTIPTALWEASMEALGAGPATAPEPAGMEPSAEEAAALGMEAVDGPKVDSKDIPAMVAKLVAEKYDAARRTGERADSNRRLALGMLPPTYAAAGVTWQQTALDAIASHDPALAARAKALAAKAVNADSYEAGQLVGILEGIASQAVDRADSKTPRWVAGVKIDAAPKPAVKIDARAPWERGESNKPKTDKVTH